MSAELESIAPTERDKVETGKARLTRLRTARENRRRKAADAGLRRQVIENEPGLRDLDRELASQDTATARDAQLAEHRAAEDAAALEKAEFEAAWRDEQRRAAQKVRG